MIQFNFLTVKYSDVNNWSVQLLAISDDYLEQHIHSAFVYVGCYDGEPEIEFFWADLMFWLWKHKWSK